jgi:HPt (histidine-containing phosphotransfer) domain-containing protein
MDYRAKDSEEDGSDEISDEYIEENTEENIEDETEIYDTQEPSYETEADHEEPVEDKWYSKITCIDTGEAIKSSGSEEAFKAVLKIFYDSIQDKYSELENNYSSKDWENYTIKIHALKSSARLVGATDLSKKAELLENAGKEGDISYIEENHPSAMEDFLRFKEALEPVFKEEAEDGDNGKPLADDFIMESIYDELRDAAEKMDCDKLEAIMEEAGEYTIPDAEKEKFGILRERADMLDYDGILEELDK